MQSETSRIECRHPFELQDAWVSNGLLKCGKFALGVKQDSRPEEVSMQLFKRIWYDGGFTLRDTQEIQLQRTTQVLLLTAAKI